MTSRAFLLEPNDSRKLVELCGQFNEHLKLIEANLSLEILSRGNSFQLIGSENNVLSGERIIKRMYRHCFSAEKEKLNPEAIHLLIQEYKNLAANPVQSNTKTEMNESMS